MKSKGLPAAADLKTPPANLDFPLPNGEKKNGGERLENNLLAADFNPVLQ